MSALRKRAAKELVDYLGEFRLNELIAKEELQSHITRTFKRYYPLLLLERAIDDNPPWADEAKTSTFKLYFRETISDICQSIILSSQGFYKPAQLSLRSGLENWIRCIGLADGQSVLTLKSVFELIALVKTVPIIADNRLASQYFSTLRSRYTHLCGYVHTSSASHMALTTMAGEYPRFLHEDASATFSAIEEVCSRIVWLFCILAEPTYRSLHHKHFDIVSDALPRKLKASFHLS